MLPHILGDCRSVFLTSRAGKVSTLLADRNGLSAFFPSSQSAANLRRCFNHSWYGTMTQRAAPHPSNTHTHTNTDMHSLSSMPPQSTLTHFQRTQLHEQHNIHTYMCTCLAPIPAGSCSKYSNSPENAAKLSTGPNELLKEEQVRTAAHLNSWGQLCVRMSVCV